MMIDVSSYSEVKYYCDNCGKDLRGYGNNLNIATSKSEANLGWKRIHVHILVREGYNNAAKERDADLCKACAVELLTDASARVSNGERMTAGTAEIKQCDWKS